MLCVRGVRLYTVGESLSQWVSIELDAAWRPHYHILRSYT